jgi:hypothetical protein
MTTIQHPTRAKITVRVWAPVLDALVTRTDAACLRRDLLISRTLQIELPRIRAEIPHRNTAKARRYIQNSLRLLFDAEPGAKQLSLALDPQVAELLESVCEEINVPRESLLNRLLLLLGAPGDFLDSHFLGFTPEPVSPEEFQPDWDGIDFTQRGRPLRSLERDPGTSRTKDVRTLASDMTKLDEASADYDQALSPLGRIAWVASDPLRWYRRMLQMRYELDLEAWRAQTQSMGSLEQEKFAYTPFGIPFEGVEELDGLHCYLPDSWIDRGTDATRAMFEKVSQTKLPLG